MSLNCPFRTTKRFARHREHPGVAREALKKGIMHLHLRLLTIATAGVCLIGPRMDEFSALHQDEGATEVDFCAMRDPVDREIKSFNRDINAMLATRDFDGLESLAKEMRESKAHFGNGMWKSYLYYASMPPSVGAPDSAWEKRLQQIDAWREAKPGSVTPAIALAEVYTGYARKVGITRQAPGKADPRTVHRERLEMALRALEDGHAAGEKDPHYWRCAHAIAAGLGWSADRLDEIYARVVALEPEYWSNDFDRMAEVLARKVGGTKAVEALAAADRCSAEIYARLAWEVNKVSGSFIEGSSFDWSRVQAGYHALTQRYPGSTGLLSQYCVMACRSRDKEAARKCFAKLGSRADLSVFGSPREYERQLRWASCN